MSDEFTSTTPSSIVTKLDRLLSNVRALKDSEYKKTMLEHVNSMCILTLLEYGAKVPNIQKLMEKSVTS